MNRLVPGFSLFACDAVEQPLLQTLAPTRASLETLTNHIVGAVLEPLVRVAAYLFFAQGLVGDLHQQNVLFDTDGSGRLSGRIVLRDLDSFRADLNVRARRGLPLRPWVDARGTCDDLKVADTHRWYDQAYGHQVRADWAFLAERLLRHLAHCGGARGDVERVLAGGRLWRAVDCLMLVAAAQHLGLAIVVNELCHVLARRRFADRRAWVRSVQAVSSTDELSSALAGLPGRACVDEAEPEPERVVFSLNAMVHAWRRITPLPERGRRAARSEVRDVVNADRVTRLRPLGAPERWWRDGDVLVARNAAGDVAAYGLPTG